MSGAGERAGVTAPTRGTDLAGDVWGGLAAMLVAFPAAIAFGLVVYASLGATAAAQGATFGILGTLAVGLVAPLFGGRPGMISAPCAPAAAVLAAQVSGMVASGHTDFAEIAALLFVTTLGAGVLQLLFSAAGGGRLIKFIPYPVVAGYLAAVGLLIVWKQLPKLLGVAQLHGAASGVLAQLRWEAILVGCVTMAVALVAHRFTRTVPASILALAAGITAYAVLSLAQVDLRMVDDNPLVVGRLNTGHGFDVAQMGRRVVDLRMLAWADLRTALATALTLAVLLSIDTLKTALVVDALTRSRHDADRELRGQGLGNVTAALVGGMPGAGTSGPTVVNISSGGRTWRSGVVAGGGALLAYLVLGGWIARVPVAALAGILIVVGLRMIDPHILDLARRRDTLLELAVVAGVIITGVVGSLLTASGVGMGLSILLFVRDQSRMSVIHRRLLGSLVHSKVRRGVTEREYLEASRDAIVLYELQGDIFFGTSDHLLGEVEPDLKRARVVVVDVKRVRSFDLTAARTLHRMAGELVDAGRRFAIAGLGRAAGADELQRYLALFGVVGPAAGMPGLAEVFDDAHDALVWAENHVLDEAGLKRKRHERPLDLAEMELFAGLDADAVRALQACITTAHFGRGEHVCRVGEQGDSLLLLRRGATRIVLPVEGGMMHLATLEPGSSLGEVAFLDPGPRSADIVADSEVDLFILSRRDFDSVAKGHPGLAAAVFERLAIAEARRLRSADRTIKLLDEG